MENALFIGLSKQVALRSNMDVIANNVANGNTVGYRGQNLMFRAFLEKPTGHDRDYSYVVDFGQYDNTDPGPLQKTSNPLDVALVGPGFMGIQSGDQTVYTRAGNFVISPNGQLTTPAGDPVMSADGGAITIPEDAGAIRITENGTIASDEGEIGQLMIVEFENPQSLTPFGKVAYTTQEDPLPATDTVVRQGFLEGSNVNMISEMTKMIAGLRQYKGVSSLVNDEDERQRTAIRRLLSEQ